jgi:hypothetical protein
MRLQRYSAALALALPLLAGCHEDDSLNSPDLSTSNGLMQRYVSMGNSITAGFQSDGINDSTQHLSFAVLFADAANAVLRSVAAGAAAPAALYHNVTRARRWRHRRNLRLRQTRSCPAVSNAAVLVPHPSRRSIT